MGHFTTHKTAFAITLAAAAFALTLAASDSIALEATEIGPGPAGQGVSPALTGKSEGPWAKAGSTLRRVFAAHAAHQQVGGGRPFDPGNPSIRYANGLILIDAVAAGDGAALLEDLRGLGLKGGTQYGAVVSGRIPLGLLDRVVGLTSLRGVSASLKPETNSSADSTFGLVHDRRGAIAMSLIGSEADPQTYTGAGIKVGVLSDTFDNNGNPDYDGNGVGEAPATNADDDYANGDLPGGNGAFVALHVPGNADFNDSSSFGATGTAGSNTTIDNTAFALDRDLPEPDGSIRFDPATFNEDPVTAVVSYPDAPQYTIADRPFTVEGWFNFAAMGEGVEGPVLASHYATTGDQRAWWLVMGGQNEPNPENTNQLILAATSDGTFNTFAIARFPFAPVPNVWYHVAVSRDGNNDLRAFVDGQQIGATDNFPVNIIDSTAPLRLSSFDIIGEPTLRPFDGWMEDFRFVVGEALYTSNFTPLGPLASSLPAPTATTTIVDDTANPGIDEGRAMMQLIHDVAPDASVSFHTAFNGMADFAQGIQELADDGADVIVDDIIYFAEPMFQDGIVAQAVDNVVSQGKAYFSSAGNAAQNSYESPFVASGERLTVNGIGGPEERGMLHDFDPSAGVDYQQSVTIPANTTFTAVLQWDQPFASNCPGCPGSDNDADIYLVDDNFQIVASSISDNLSTGEPVEVLQLQNIAGFYGTDFHILITHYDVKTPQHPKPGPPPNLMKYVWFGHSSITVNEYNTDSPASYGHSSAAGAGAVGAAYYLDTPAFGVSPPSLEWFSSQGGNPILFDKLGYALGVPEVREKPNFVAPDGTNTTFFFRDTSTDDADEAPNTFPNFFGTSAAAPHAASIAALMLEANPGLLPADIYAALSSTAIEMGPAGFDHDTGYGLIDANAALAQVTGGNLTPVANDDSAATDQLTALQIDVLFNDTLGDQPTTITNVTQPVNGSVAVNDGNTPADPSDDFIDYTPNGTHIGNDPFTYEISDSDNPAETDTATVNVTVTEANVAPDAEDDLANTPEDTPVLIDVLANEISLGNEPTVLSAGAVSTNGGTVAVDDNGTPGNLSDDKINYDPADNFAGPDSFTYTITDSDSPTPQADNATVSVTVQPVNDAPVFDDTSYVRANAVAGEPYTGETLAGTATDIELNGLTYSITAGPLWLTITADGVLGGTPLDPDDVGFTAFEVTVTDDGTPAELDTANLFITVVAPSVNNAPVADNDNYNTNEDTPLNVVAAAGVLIGDTDGDGPAALTAVLDTTTPNGLLVLNADGSFSYTPNADFNGDDSFTYHANDDADDSNIATVTIAVASINDAPVADNDNYNTDQDTPLNIAASGVLIGDTDDDGPSALTAVLNTTTSSGALALNANGSFSYTPNPAFNGADSFSYHANDGADDSNIATVNITVNPAAVLFHVGALEGSSAPASRGRWDATVIITVNDAVGGTVANATVNGTWSNGTSGGASCVTGVSGQCSVSKVNLKGNVPSVDFIVGSITGAGTYDPSANNPADATVTVFQNGPPADLLPNAVDDSVSVFEDTQGNPITVLDNDGLGDAPTTITDVTDPPNGTTTIVGSVIEYTPDPGHIGADSFNYTITDLDGDTSSAIVTIDVVTNAGPVDVHVGGLAGSSAAAPKNRWDATVIVTVHDNAEGSVANATVNGTWSNGTNGGSSCVTTGSGQCSVTKNDLKGNVGSVVFTVDTVTGSNMNYVSGSDHIPGSAITVLQ